MDATLILGASGATGKHVVQQLIALEQPVKVLVRPTAHIPEAWHRVDALTVLKANIHEMTVDEMAHHLEDCNAMACCLGHTLSLKGI